MQNTKENPSQVVRHASVERAHAELGASIAKRWIECPGSVRLSREVPQGASSAYAEEGTAAHALAELCLRSGADPAAHIGKPIQAKETTFIVDEAMADAVRVYVVFCRRLIDEATEFWIEQKFDLAPFEPPASMFGTSDFVAFSEEESALHVVDLKFGQGVVVEAIDNPQLRYYALGAYCMLPARSRVESVTVTIVQPRAAHPDGVVRSDTFDILDLLAFAQELLSAAHRTQEPDAPLKAGAHCRFCPASAVCPEQLANAQLVAQTDFDVVPVYRPPAPSTLTTEQLAEFLPKLDIIEQWITDVRNHARAMLQRGEEVPGVKLVEKRATRRWINEDAAYVQAAGRGYDRDDLCETKIKSPAQIEKLFGKKTFRALLEQYTEKKSSGLVMVADDDPRPAVSVTGGEEFLALSSGE